MNKTLLIIFLTNLFANIITGNEGSTVAIVYNSKLQESKSVADYYAKSRSVPEKNLIGLPLSVNHTITRKEFKKNTRTAFNQSPSKEKNIKWK